MPITQASIVECNLESTVFNMIISNDWEQFRIETLATKEPETVRWILDNFRAGDTLFDIGANIGVYSILAAAHNPAGVVVAVEPMAASFARLCQNALINELHNVRPYCVAISAANGLATLNLSSMQAASSMHSLDSAPMTESFGETVVTRTGIGLATIDTLASAAGVPSLMKIDVDGAEDSVLAGAGAVLRDRRLRTVLIEFNWTGHGARDADRDEPLRRTGFLPVAAGAMHERGSVKWQNTIYTRTSPS